MPKIRVVVEFPIQEETVLNGQSNIQILNDLHVVSDEVLDGSLVTRKGAAGDPANEFYLGEASIVFKEIVEDHQEFSTPHFDQLLQDILNVINAEDVGELTEDEIDNVMSDMGNYDYSHYNEHIHELIQEQIASRQGGQ